VPALRGGGPEPYPLSGRGQVFSYATVYDAPAGHEAQASYVVALVELIEGARVVAHLTDVDRD
jgi:uncharacterized protein